MAINLTSVVTQFLTPEVIAQIASFLGIDRNVAQKATGATIPTILAGLSDLVGTPAGTNQLTKALSQQQVGSPMDMLRNSGAQGLAQTGSSMLSGLFGGRTMDAMGQAIGRFAGTGESGGKSLLALVGPLVLGALGQHQRDSGLDANGLASLLRSQKDQITSAIPSGLADQLGAAGLIDKAEAGVRNATAAASAAGSRISNTSGWANTGTTRPAYATANRSQQWPYWLAALAVVAGLGWYGLQRPMERTTVADNPPPARPAATTGTVGMAPSDLNVDGVNLANQTDSAIGKLKAALPTVTDDASAQAALPKINDAVSQLDGVKGLAAKLSPDGRSTLAKLIAAAMPAINQLSDKALAAPGGSALKPAIDNLHAKLDALAKV